MFEHIWLVLLDYQLHPHLELELCEIFHEDCGLLEWLGLGFEDLAPSLSSFNFRKVQIWPRTFPLCIVKNKVRARVGKVYLHGSRVCLTVAHHSTGHIGIIDVPHVVTNHTPTDNKLPIRIGKGTTCKQNNI